VDFLGFPVDFLGFPEDFLAFSVNFTSIFPQELRFFEDS